MTAWLISRVAAGTRLTIVVLAALSMTSLSAPAQRTIPRERTLQVVAHAGQELRVQNYASWDRDCQARPAPQIVVLHPPAHGMLSIRPGTSTVSIVREGATDCTGHQYPGTTVWYTPAAGYVGPDQFDLDVASTRSTAHDTVVVEVRR